MIFNTKCFEANGQGCTLMAGSGYDVGLGSCSELRPKECEGASFGQVRSYVPDRGCGQHTHTQFKTRERKLRLEQALFMQSKANNK